MDVGDFYIIRIILCCNGCFFFMKHGGFKKLPQIKAGGSFAWPFSQMETHTFPDGTRTVTTTDSEGNTHSHEEQVYSTVTFEVFYNDGRLSVSSKDDSVPMAAGFSVGVHYHDGYGDAYLPNTGTTKHCTNLSTTKGQNHVGVDASFDPNETNERMFDVRRFGKVVF